jgi:hypothetical protein
MSGTLKHISGEPLRLTAAEWANIATIEAPEGPVKMGFSIGLAIHDRDPDAPLLTHDEYLTEKSA